MDTTQSRKVLLINRFPYWIFKDFESYFDELDDVCILHLNSVNFDFPAHKYSNMVTCDLSDEEMVLQAAQYLHTYHQFNMVVNLSEMYMELAAKIREKFHLNGMDLEKAACFRNKLRMKEVVQAAGLNAPNNSKVVNKDNIREFFNENGKSILKPVNGMGTEKTYVISCESDIDLTYKELIDVSNYEVEQFIDGQMYHCDSVIVNGEAQICSISRYLNSTLDFSKTGYLASVMIDDGERKDIIRNFNQQVVKAFNYDNGVAHHELFLSQEKLIFCEIGARSGGAGIIPSVKHVYNVNLFGAHMKLQTNGALNLEYSAGKLAGWIVFHSKEGIVSEISNADDFDLDWIYYKGIYAKRGDIVKKATTSVSSIAEFTVTGTSEKDIVQKLEWLRNEFIFNVTPIGSEEKHE